MEILKIKWFRFIFYYLFDELEIFIIFLRNFVIFMIGIYVIFLNIDENQDGDKDLVGGVPAFLKI
jgi:hypothetical protein